MLSICFDGALAMIEQNNSGVAFLRDFLGRTPFSHHFITHQEALCANNTKLNDVTLHKLHTRKVKKTKLNK